MPAEGWRGERETAPAPRSGSGEEERRKKEGGGEKKEEATNDTA